MNIVWVLPKTNISVKILIYWPIFKTLIIWHLNINHLFPFTLSCEPCLLGKNSLRIRLLMDFFSCKGPNEMDASLPVNVGCQIFKAQWTKSSKTEMTVQTTIFTQSAMSETGKACFSHMAIKLSSPKSPRSQRSTFRIKNYDRLKLALYFRSRSKLELCMMQNTGLGLSRVQSKRKLKFCRIQFKLRTTRAVFQPSYVSFS